MIILHMLKMYVKYFLAVITTFGFFSKDFLQLLGVPFYVAFIHFTLFLDYIFYPKFAKQEIKNPIFIIGHPRSGTTFFHRLMLKTEEYVSFQTWQLTLPALTARKIFKPVINNLVKKGKHVLFPKEVGHEVRLNLIEEEEQLFMPLLDSQFTSIAFPLGFYDGDFDEVLYNDKQAHKNASIKYFKRCLQRQIYATGKKQIMARCNFSGMRIKTLAKQFPDAKFIYIYRNPLESIPSHLSLNFSVFDYRWGKEKIGEKKIETYMKRRYKYNVAYYKYVEEAMKSDEIKNNVLQIHYQDLLSNFDETIKKAEEFMNIDFSDAMRKTIAEQSEKQKNYKRKHKVYDLEKFGFSEEQLRKELDFMFEKIAQ